MSKKKLQQLNVDLTDDCDLGVSISSVLTDWDKFCSVTKVSVVILDIDSYQKTKRQKRKKKEREALVFSTAT
jgi:hypothetical protein